MLPNIFENQELRIKLQYCLDSIVFTNEALHKQLGVDFNKLFTINEQGKIFINLAVFPSSYYTKFIKDKVGEYSSALTKHFNQALSLFLAVNIIHSHQFIFTIVDIDGTIMLRGLFCHSEILPV